MHIEKIKKIIWNTENKRKPYIRIINYMVLLLSVLQYSPCGDEPGNIRDGHPQWNSI